MRALVALAACVIATACGEVWNDPYPASERGTGTLYTAFAERPKHLDPVQSYSENEATFIQQIYEPPLQYHYLKRPYELIPATALEVPRPRLFDSSNRELPPDAGRAEYSVYEIRIRPGILYQPHPAFARDAAGRARYLALGRGDLERVWTIADFEHSGTRELTAEDYVYQIKRLAHPRLHSPILHFMFAYIAGLSEFAESLAAADKALVTQRGKDAWLDLSRHDFPGAEVVDRYTYRIRIRGHYPQFVYWLAMPFFAPVPIDVDRFYSQPGMAERNLTLDWWPVGTGPYMLAENNPNTRMILVRNPNFHGETYPAEGEPGDRDSGLLADAGKPIPFIDRVVFTRENEGIPYWNKFLQGYYDSSGIASDSFDQAVRVGVQGEATVSPEMEMKGIQLKTQVEPSSTYLGFNWLDPVVGGDSERARKLRQAISIAVDMEEYISIFMNGRAVAAMGPVPPGIFGYLEGEAGINPVAYDWVDARPRRKTIETAKALLAEAGYPEGRDARTGQPLVLNFDVTGRGPGDKSRFDWYRKQMAKIRVQLEIRETDYNRFQDKVRKGSQQLFWWGWNADYPDPENFLFLFLTGQSRAKYQGENSANYSNPEFDRLFARMNSIQNGPARQEIISRMYAILHRDAPWIWGYHTKEYILQHSWLSHVKPNFIARNKLKYYKVDAAQRAARRAEWNRPALWPLALAAALLVALIAPAVASYRRRERAAARTA